MLNKKKMPLRCWHTGRGFSKKCSADCFTDNYTPEFTDCQAEKIFNRDLNWVIAGCIVILVLCILGVI